MDSAGNHNQDSTEKDVPKYYHRSNLDQRKLQHHLFPDLHSLILILAVVLKTIFVFRYFPINAMNLFQKKNYSQNYTTLPSAKVDR